MGAVYRGIDLRFDAPVAIKENRIATSASQKQFIREALQEKLGYPFDLVFLEVAEIARSPGGKYEDFRSEIA